ncbi:hypothetical protein COCSUDRAFT_34500 [Coccomyxa subellipsoidea C-169]|uniref:Uncharacterized protein n=1 Tax=Coccomyxa subellipsoidea (strain C-169) TaxID=574566 RepID=I0YJA8_COCSC|nr:hypothetical protein COCSUDRAFT_34500 [Coccomyxa subellipsoidea C-169]EIE18477.1 hypothetical protein COCSUDRAFT_34500 [Coccomyxa subellipsoidea C-169]|eukprot:XP_005643021.1 hypothetical protein COCSUDRAFT_34500 [Coccomyxa subellipsoidea C-169]
MAARNSQDIKLFKLFYVLKATQGAPKYAQRAFPDSHTPTFEDPAKKESAWRDMQQRI